MMYNRGDLGMNMTIIGGASMPVRDKAPSPLESVHAAVSTAGRVEERLTRLAQRLAGAYAEPAAESDENHSHELSIFDALGAAGEALCGSLGRMDAAISAIEQKLP